MKTDVDVIEAVLSIAISRRATTRSPGRTVGTITKFTITCGGDSAVGVPTRPDLREADYASIERTDCARRSCTGSFCKTDDRIMILAPRCAEEGCYLKKLRSGAGRVVLVADTVSCLPLDETPVLDKRKNHTIEVVN